MIQNLIRLNYINRKKIADMCIALLPKVGYARVTRSGIVILKKSKWCLFGKRIPVTDICIKYIPIEVGKLICKKENRAVYVSMFNDKVATIVSLTKHVERMDLFDTIYGEYTKACMIVEPSELVVKNYKEPIVPRFQSFNVKTMLQTKKSSKVVIQNKHSISRRVEKLKERLNQSFTIIPVINLRMTTR